MKSLDFDFIELLDSVTIARSRKHIEKFYDTSEIGSFPVRRQPISYHCPLTQRNDVIGFNDIFAQLTLLNLAVYAPISYIQPGRLPKYEELYDTEVQEGRGKLKQADRETSLQALMTVNLLKRLESSVEAFRLILKKLKANHLLTLSQIETYQQTGKDADFADVTAAYMDAEPDEDEFPDPDEMKIGGKIQISLSDMDLPRWEHDLKADLDVACFDSGITEDFVKELAKRKPLRAVFRDDSFESDNVKINTEQIFKLMSPNTDVKSI
jgi:hypothetical protein